MPEIKKYLNRDGLEEYNSLLPHSSSEMQTYVNDWLGEHPEATTTVQDGAITDRKLADKSVSLRTLADDTVHMLKGAILTGNLSGEVLTADDAYSAPPIALTVEGKSTQDGTPTPDVPVEIESIGQILLHASADGTMDAIGWPVLVQLTRTLKSLPSNTCDELHLTWLRNSEHEGYAWYEVTGLVRIGISDLGSFDWAPRTAARKWFASIAPMRSNTPATQRMCSAYTVIASQAHSQTPANNTISPRSINNSDYVYVRDDRYPPETTTPAEFKAAVTGVKFQYLMNVADYLTPDYGEIELPVLPAPDVTVWAEPSTGLTMEYVRDANIVIQNIEQAIADL